MPLPSLPPAFALLKDDPSPAVDRGLVEVLCDLEPRVQACALELLLGRGHVPSLSAVVTEFHRYGETLQLLILARTGDLSSGVRAAIASPALEDRSKGIELIALSRNASLVYLLADATRSSCSHTREKAALSLHRLTDDLLRGFEADPSADEIVELNGLANGLAEALGKAIRLWEIHLQPKVLQASLWMCDRLEGEIVAKLQEKRSKLVRVICNLVEGSSDPRLAGFILRALAVPELRSVAAATISGSKDVRFLDAVLAQTWLLSDERIERGCRRIRSGPWVQVLLGALPEKSGPWMVHATRLFAAMGGTAESRIELFRELLGFGIEELRLAVFWQLARDQSDTASELLALIASRQSDRVARLAKREWRRRRPRAITPASPTSVAESDGSAILKAAFDEYWEHFDEWDDHRRSKAGETLRRDGVDLGIRMRAKLASIEPLDRVRAVRMVADLGWAKEVEEILHRLVYDSDALVRGVVVSLLAEIPGATTLRLLRAAIDDPDERVQANAIEVLDLLDIENRIACTRGKLESPNSRVRANAVTSLLRAELRQAGETLLDMLEDTTTAHRLSALWVIERLQLETVRRRLMDMSRNDPDERVRQRARHTLSQLDGDRAATGRAQTSVEPDALGEPVGDTR